MSEQTGMSAPTLTDPWASRIGSPAAQQRRLFRVQRRNGIALLIAVPAIALVVWWMFVAQDGNPSVLAVAGLCTLGVVVAIFGFVELSLGFDACGRAIDLGLAYLRHDYPGVTAFEVQGLLVSLESFDEGVTGEPTAHVAQVVTADWSPDIVRPILPGMTEATLVTLHRWTGLVAVIPTVGLALLGATRHVPALGIWYSGWAVVGVVFLISFAFWLAALRRGTEEFREGYTTSPTGTMLVGRGQTRPVDAHSSLDFVDGKTGYLLRHSNAVLLTPPRYAERLRQIRAAHPGSTPARIEP